MAPAVPSAGVSVPRDSEATVSAPPAEEEEEEAAPSADDLIADILG